MSNIRADLSGALLPFHGLTDPDGGSVRRGGGTYGPNDAERWLADYEAEHIPPVTESAKGQNVVIGPNLDAARRSGNVDIDALASDLSDYGQGDPQRAYDTATGHLMSEAVHEALRTSLDLRDLQESIRQSHNGLRFMTEAESNALPDHGKGYSGNSATFKGARKAVLEAYAALTREASEALLPYGSSADRWAMHGSPDPLTYGSPVVTQRMNKVYAVDAQGTVYPPLTLCMATRVAMHAQTRKDGIYQPEVIPLPWMSPVQAIDRTDPAWIADQWTAYRPDVNTVAADRFAAKRRPTSDESADPLPPVRKPTSRKRKRDGAMGGPAILSHR
jgi:hypothetical protein